jgi:hypothetical protein
MTKKQFLQQFEQLQDMNRKIGELRKEYFRLIASNKKEDALAIAEELNEKYVEADDLQTMFLG